MMELNQEVTTINGVKGTVIKIENETVEITSKTGVTYIVPISVILDEPKKSEVLPI